MSQQRSQSLKNLNTHHSTAQGAVPPTGLAARVVRPRAVVAERRRQAVGELEAFVALHLDDAAVGDQRPRQRPVLEAPVLDGGDDAGRWGGEGGWGVVGHRGGAAGLISQKTGNEGGRIWSKGDCFKTKLEFPA